MLRRVRACLQYYQSPLMTTLCAWPHGILRMLLVLPCMLFVLCMLWCCCCERPQHCRLCMHAWQETAHTQSMMAGSSTSQLLPASSSRALSQVCNYQQPEFSLAQGLSTEYMSMICWQFHASCVHIIRRAPSRLFKGSCPRGVRLRVSKDL